LIFDHINKIPNVGIKRRRIHVTTVETRAWKAASWVIVVVKQQREELIPATELTLLTRTQLGNEEPRTPALSAAPAGTPASSAA